MKEARSHSTSDIKVHSVDMEAIRYSITGSYGVYVFQAIAADTDSEVNIEEGHIEKLRIRRKTKTNDHNDDETLFDYGYGYSYNYSDALDDMNALKHICAFLESLLLERPDDMAKIGNV